MEIPSISIIIPTLNSANVLSACLESIRNQDYPREKVEIIVIDAGSIDATIEIAKKYETDKILSNPLKTGEAGKAVGVKAAKNEILALIDSDNILDRTDWLRRMIDPFEDEAIVGTEPLYYTYNKRDAYITRYCALLGMSDPSCLFLGNYDRFCYITNRWTEIQLKEVDKGWYLKVELNAQKSDNGCQWLSIPERAARGLFFR